MTDSAVAVYFDKSLDVQSNVSSKVALNFQILIDIVTDFSNVVFCQIPYTGVGIDARCFKDIISGFATDSYI